jgi:YegS/Rv2252/BmrU family lipid kinase
MKKLLFIYNPFAGKGRITQQLGSIVEVFQSHGYLPTLYATQGTGDGVWAASAMGEEYDHIVCCGGDGTLSEVVTGLYNHELKGMTLGYIPAGSTNDFSKTLELPLEDLQQAAECAVAGCPQPCDVGIVGEDGHLFTYVAAFGVFTDTSYATPQPMKNLLGHTAYLLAGIGSLANLKVYHMKVTFDEGEIEDDFIYGMVSNSVSVGGFQGVNPEPVVLDDGLFEVLLVRAPKAAGDLSQIVAALISHRPNENCIALRSSRLRFESEKPVAWTLDGEFGGEHKCLEVSNLPKFVTILSGRGEGNQLHL